MTLHVKPQITEGGILKLQLYQEDSSVDTTTTNNPGGVTINKRSIQSTMLADNGEIIVIGGLMQDNYNAGNSKMPLLGDIPWIGQPVSQRKQDAHEDQPDGVPAPGDRARPGDQHADRDARATTICASSNTGSTIG